MGATVGLILSAFGVVVVSFFFPSLLSALVPLVGATGTTVLFSVLSLGGSGTFSVGFTVASVLVLVLASVVLGFSDGLVSLVFEVSLDAGAGCVLLVAGGVFCAGTVAAGLVAVSFALATGCSGFGAAFASVAAAAGAAGDAGAGAGAASKNKQNPHITYM